MCRHQRHRHCSQQTAQKHESLRCRSPGQPVAALSHNSSHRAPRGRCGVLGSGCAGDGQPLDPPCRCLRRSMCTRVLSTRWVTARSSPGTSRQTVACAAARNGLGTRNHGLVVERPRVQDRGQIDVRGYAGHDSPRSQPDGVRDPARFRSGGRRSVWQEPTVATAQLAFAIDQFDHAHQSGWRVVGDGTVTLVRAMRPSGHGDLTALHVGASLTSLRMRCFAVPTATDFWH